MNEVVLPDCPPPIFAIGHSMGGTVMMRVARQGSRWFDRIVLSAPMIRLSGKRNAVPAKITVRAMRLIGMGSAYVPGGGETAVATGSYVNNIATSDPVRHARTKAVLEAAPELGHRLADRVVARRGLSHDGRHRQSVLRRARCASR